jgi:hypothetical protein
MPSLIGNKPNQVPSNGDLGTLAFQDSNAVNIVGGTAVVDNLTADSINLRIDHDLSNISPSLLLDFANTKALDPRITFTRASTASFYDGRTTAKAEENLISYSQEFDNAYWSKNASTVTTNTSVAPDGTTTAETLTASAGTALAPRTFPTTLTGITSTVHAISIFAKAGTNNFLQITDATVGFHANFDLSAGTVGTSASCTPSIVSAGNGWHRCIVTYTSGGTDIRPLFVLVTGSSVARLATFNPVGTETILLWGAQQEQRSAVSAYTPTTTAPITNYIPALRTAQAGQARFDHAPLTGESLGLLIEEQRTNLVTYSDDLANAAWSKVGASVTSNVLVSPDGTLTSDKLVEDTSTGSHRIEQNGTTTITNPVTFSVFAKAAERNQISLQIVDNGTGSNGGSVYFNLSTGVAFSAAVDGSGAGASATITAVGNGWYRCSFTVTTNGSGTAVRARTYLSTTGTTRAYTGDGYSGIYIWGAQLEAGAFATSYIPTVASQVTRSTDAASMTGLNFSSWYRADEGTLYAESFSESARTVAAIGQGSFVTNIIFNFANLVRFAGAAPSLTLGTSVNGNIKLAAALKPNDFAVSANGTAVVTSALNLTIQSFANQLQIGFSPSSSTLNGTIKKLAYYPVRLPNAELQEMTS